MKLFYTFILSISFLIVNAQISFETFGLEMETFDNNSDIGFSEGDITLPNSFNSTYSFFTGFALSTMTDTITEGFLNQYSVISGVGANNTMTYAIGYLTADNSIYVNNGSLLESLQINNTTFAGLSIQNGDGFAKKFGGETGDDPDFFLLTMKFYDNNIPTGDSIEFYLADYRFDDNELDYIIKDWTTIDLSEINSSYDEIKLILSSSDIGAFGMNTPAYIAIDELQFLPSSSIETVDDNIHIYPNPAIDLLNVEVNSISHFYLFNSIGESVLNGELSGESKINISHLIKGVYFLRIENEDGRTIKTIIKQ